MRVRDWQQHTTQPPPPLAVSHGEERGREAQQRERKRRERDDARRESRRLGLPVSGVFLHSFASKFLMREGARSITDEIKNGTSSSFSDIASTEVDFGASLGEINAKTSHREIESLFQQNPLVFFQHI
ncbi:unnamed protein product [Brassica rapa]|uniref:BnaA07g03720D protein n=2 Tax=Brassica TaxID=3705 RepID=A0A078IAI1_BRANA|nr:unnamed protein product [Brassica rapa]CDY46198.1 BnaA07g03720D [Brassica napus]VDC95876.1 unnamed protein product [Brassica rapa]